MSSFSPKADDYCQLATKYQKGKEGKKETNLIWRKTDMSTGFGGEEAAITMECGSAVVITGLDEGKCRFCGTVPERLLRTRHCSVVCLTRWCWCLSSECCRGSNEEWNLMQFIGVEIAFEA